MFVFERFVWAGVFEKDEIGICEKIKKISESELIFGFLVD